MERWLLLAAMGLAGCKDKGGSSSDTGDPGETGETGETGDPGPGVGWGWCPAPEDAVASGTETLTVTEDALYCALGHGPTLAQELANHVQLRLVPGAYALPGEDGMSDYALPACLRGEDEAVPSEMAGSGTMNRTSNESFPYYSWYLSGQPLTRDGEAWELGFSLSAFPQDGQMPDLVFDDALTHGTYPDTEAFLYVCRGDCEQDQRYVYPCEPASTSDEPTYTLGFDRGTISVWTSIVPGSSGPSAPEVFYRAEGTLDGEPFAQDDYWEMAHVSEHHNRGGGFLVRFAEPIAGACGITAEIPSPDGSFYFKELRAALIACDGAEIEELSGVVAAD